MVLLENEIKRLEDELAFQKKTAEKGSEIVLDLEKQINEKRLEQERALLEEKVELANKEAAERARILKEQEKEEAERFKRRQELISLFEDIVEQRANDRLDALQTD